MDGFGTDSNVVILAGRDIENPQVISFINSYK